MSSSSPSTHVNLSYIPYERLPTDDQDAVDHKQISHTMTDINLNKASHTMERSFDTSSSSINTRGYSKDSLMKAVSALFYASTSFLIIVVNKIVLTTYNFPSSNILGLGQMVATIAVLGIGKKMGIISFPSPSRDLPRKIFPLPLLYIGNLMFGLSGTQKLSLPMFTVLRRFTILLTLILEYVVLRIQQSNTVILTVVGMIVGAIVAAADDLSFDATGYAFVIGNDICTAANGVYLKKKLDSRQLGKYGLMFYNSLFMLVPLFIISWIAGDIHKVTRTFFSWTDIGFLSAFISSCLMGFLLMYSTVLCTSYNSALATTIIGCLKNILVTYVGMYIGGDYVFSLTNFLGLNISMAASLIYSYVTFVQGKGSSG